MLTQEEIQAIIDQANYFHPELFGSITKGLQCPIMVLAQLRGVPFADYNEEAYCFNILQMLEVRKDIGEALNLETETINDDGIAEFSAIMEKEGPAFLNRFQALLKQKRYPDPI